MPSFPKRPRLRLERGDYERLRREVLERDGWRCQSCGSRVTLEIHHAKRRSAGGNDNSDNLITLCALCHRHWHNPA